MQGSYRKRSVGALIYLKIVLEIIRISNYDNIVLKQTINRKEVTINCVIDPYCNVQGGGGGCRNYHPCSRCSCFGVYVHF